MVFWVIPAVEFCEVIIRVEEWLCTRRHPLIDKFSSPLTPNVFVAAVVGLFAVFTLLAVVGRDSFFAAVVPRLMNSFVYFGSDCSSKVATEGGSARNRVAIIDERLFCLLQATFFALWAGDSDFTVSSTATTAFLSF